MPKSSTVVVNTIGTMRCPLYSGLIRLNCVPFLKFCFRLIVPMEWQTNDFWKKVFFLVVLFSYWAIFNLIWVFVYIFVAINKLESLKHFKMHQKYSQNQWIIHNSLSWDCLIRLLPRQQQIQPRATDMSPRPIKAKKKDGKKLSCRNNVESISSHSFEGVWYRLIYVTGHGLRAPNTNRLPVSLPKGNNCPTMLQKLNFFLRIRR